MQRTPDQNLDRNEYLEEAKNHLETIERGLLNLSGVIQQPETLQRLYAAAESLNAGAAAHEIETLQQIAQFFEDCFGVMGSASVVSDKRLEELLWRVFDTFQGLVDMHARSEEPTEYTRGVEKEVLKGLQPLLTDTKKYLKSRILHEEATVSELTPESDFFHQQIETELQAMEEILNKENPSYHRAELKEHCQVLEQIGEQGKLPTWVKLVKIAQRAIAAPENSVKTAAQRAITDIREAQKLIARGEGDKIEASQRLKAMSLQLSSLWESTNDEEDIDLELEEEAQEENNQDDSELNWDEKGTLVELDGIPDADLPSVEEELGSLTLEGDLWDGEEISLDAWETPEENSALERWGKQQVLSDDNSDWWQEQETIIETNDHIEEENSPESLTQNGTDDDDSFFEDIFGEEEPIETADAWAEDDWSDGDNCIIEADDSLQTNELWDALEESLEQSGEEASAESTISNDNEEDLEWEELFSALESTQDTRGTEEDQLKHLISNSDIESVFGENEQTLVQSLEQDETSSSGSPQGAGVGKTFPKSNLLPTYEAMAHLSEMIDAPAKSEKEESLDVAALETYIEQRPQVSSTEPEQPAPVAKVEVEQKATPAPATAKRGETNLFEQTVKVPVRLMDHLNNLIGELVVNRNSLEQDQERLRRFLDNLLEQVQSLNDLGVRMQDLYERSLLENSLLASKTHSSSLHEGTRETYNGGSATSTSTSQYSNGEYDPLEMDRFSGFHLLSQEMMELIVRVRESTSDIEFLVDEVEQEARVFRQVTTQLQEGFTSARMVPFSQVADRLPRAVRDISLKLNKKAKLQVEGKDTLVDKMILEQLYDPMTHLVNNAITHGIELPKERTQQGKPETGTITVKANHQGNQSIISISDDGAGLDPIRIRRKAVEKGLISKEQANSLPDIDIFDFIFHPGFSTRDQADDFAGRGVGMDVVRSSLSKLRGSINIDSTPGKGTTFIIGLPLTLSITTALCCKLNQSSIAFPMDGVEDKFETTKDNIKVNQKGERFIRWQKSSTLLPFKHLSELMSYNRSLTRSNIFAAQEETEEISVVVLRSTGNLIAVQVDQVLGQQEIVIKQLSEPVPKPIGIAGATVTSEGSVMAIADVLELVDLFYGRVRKDVMNSMLAQQEQAVDQEQGDAEPLVLIVDDSITVRELLSMTFTKSGYRVEQARDGKEAWEKLRAGLACDMMFCDIEMPRMDGLELLSRVKEEERFANLPVGMLTSRGAERHRQMAARLGAKGYFTKPYLEEVLLDAAKRMLEGENMITRKATTGAGLQ